MIDWKRLLKAVGITLLIFLFFGGIMLLCVNPKFERVGASLLVVIMTATMVWGVYGELEK